MSEHVDGCCCPQCDVRDYTKKPPPCPTCAEKDATIKAMSERTDRHCKMLVKRDDRIDTLEHDKHAADARATAAERREAELRNVGANRSALLTSALPFLDVDPRAERLAGFIRAALASPSTPSPAPSEPTDEPLANIDKGGSVACAECDEPEICRFKGGCALRYLRGLRAPSPAPMDRCAFGVHVGPIASSTCYCGERGSSPAVRDATVEHCAQCQTPVPIPPGYWPICQACVDATNATLDAAKGTR